MFDYTSDLHWDNAMMGGPLGWPQRVDVSPYKNPESTILLVAGDTCEHVDDTVGFLNTAAEHYETVIAVLGNHEDGTLTIPVHERVHVLDFEQYAYRAGATLYAGNCMETIGETAAAAEVINHAQGDDTLERIIVLSHLVPSPLLHDNRYPEKCNSLLHKLDPPQKPTTIVFGHLHIPYVGEMGGFRLLSAPRGYRGVNRDGSAWPKKFGFEP